MTDIVEYEKTSIEFISALRASLLAEADGEDEISIRLGNDMT